MQCYIRPELLYIQQVGNHADCQSVRARIENVRDKTGKYPDRLPETMDRWGHLLSYEKLADGYLLVSYGRDGKPDGSNYRSLRSQGDHPSGYSICGQWDADEVVSDKGWHRLCGK